MKQSVVSRRFVRIAVLAWVVANWLLAGAGGAAAANDWTTTFQVQCTGEPNGYYIQSIGNLLDKQGRAMGLDGSKTNPLFGAPCWTNLPETFTYTYTTQHEPTQVVFNWSVVGIYTGETLLVCSPGGVTAAMPAAASSNCGAYGSITVSAAATR